jgi:hypothetical protein
VTSVRYEPQPRTCCQDGDGPAGIVVVGLGVIVAHHGPSISVPSLLDYAGTALRQ